MVGLPILPKISSAADDEVVRREKMAWEEISVKAAKIVSFSGKILFFQSLFNIYFKTAKISPATSDI